MDTLKLLYERAPSALEQALPSSQLTDVIEYSEMIGSGTSQATAQARIDNRREARTSAPKAALLDAARDAAKDVKPAKIKNQLDGFFGAPFAGGERAALTAVSEYRRHYEQAFADSNGNDKVAEKAAKGQMRKVYGVSKVTGSARTMAYPPERFYHVPGVDDKWMEAALRSEVEDWFGARGRKADLGAIYLQADTTTKGEAQNGERPGYLIAVEFQHGDRAGQFEFIPGRYYFPDEPIRARIMKDKEKKTRDTRDRAAAFADRANQPGGAFEKAQP